MGCVKGKKKGWTYPMFDIEWKPVSENVRGSEFTKKYLNTIKKLAKGANEDTVATDYDQEGEVIGLNVIRYACGKKDAYRMKFSTLTKDELREAYSKKASTLTGVRQRPEKRAIFWTGIMELTIQGRLQHQ